MNVPAYLFVWLLIRFFAILPMRVAYLFADFIFVLLYYFPAYRKKIVFKNLTNAFPEKSKAERQDIARKFYRYLADQIVESAKTFSMSPEQIKKRVFITNHELYQSYLASNQDLILISSHYANWELCSAGFSLQVPFTLVGVYLPQKNKRVDQLIKKCRERSGMWMESAKTISRNIEKILFHPNMIGLISDQHPANRRSGHWMKFLNQDTYITTGPEGFAKRTGRPVLFAEAEKLRRGYYSITLHVIEDHPAVSPKYSITEKHVQLLEKIILKKPELWLWSHNRWKHKRAT